MKTRSRDPDPLHGLPPPPAPTARDANPWTIGGGEKPRGGTGAAVPPETSRSPRFPVRQVEHPKPRKPPVVPVMILAVVALVPLGGALRAIGAGAPAEAVGPLIALGFMAFIALRMLRSRRS
jgi:hypothetical protein